MGPELMYMRQREAELRARAELHRRLQEARESAGSEHHERTGGGWRLLRRRPHRTAPASAPAPAPASPC